MKHRLDLTLLLAGCASATGLVTGSSIDDANHLAAAKSLSSANLSPAAWPNTDGWKPFNDARLDNIAVEQCNQALADALREVVDQLTSFRSVEEQRQEQRQTEADDLALLRYRDGIGNDLQVLSAEQPLLVKQSLDADSRARQLNLAINLAHALGGGFAESALQ